MRNLLKKNGGFAGNYDSDPDGTSDSQSLPNIAYTNLYVSQDRVYPFKQYGTVKSVTVS